MGLIADIGAIAAGVLAATVARVLADDLKEWTPYVVNRLIARAVTALPDDQSKERLGEEWRSHAADIPGTIAKLWFAAQCRTASLTIVRESLGETGWAVAVIDQLAFRGAKIIQRPLLNALRAELLKQCEPALCDKAVREVECRFEPVLRQLLPSKLRQFGNYQESADAIRREFARVIWDYRQELQSQAKHTLPTSAPNIKRDLTE